MDPRRITLTLGAAVGGLLAAAFLPVAVAFADEYEYTPDPFTPSITWGSPPDDMAAGSDLWNAYDLTTHTSTPDALNGLDIQTTFLGLTNDDFFVNTSSSISAAPVDGTQIDLLNFGGGFENEWIDVVTGSNIGVTDVIITPFGDIPF